MKKIVVVILLLNSTLVYSQNIIKVGKSLRTLKTTNIQRIIEVNTARSFQAIDVARYQALNAHMSWYFKNTDTQVQIYLERKLLTQTLKSPRTIYGPYNYVRTFSKISKDEDLTSKKYLQDWKHINDVTGYNGAHHIVNKYTLKLIWEKQKQSGIKTNLDDMQKNAPAIFHPYHGDPRFKDIFHNPEQQLHDYEVFGMKIVIISLLAQIDAVGIEMGLSKMPEDYLMGILKEAELWSKTYNLVWQRDTKLIEPMLKIP